MSWQAWPQNAKLDFLSALGCAVGQGYLFGSALPADRIAELLQKTVEAPKLAA